MIRVYKVNKLVLFVLFFVFIAISLAACSGEIIKKKIYPLKYREFVEKYADEYGLDRHLVYAVIKTESKFNPEAVSDAGAVGLMQLLESTAQECNKKTGFGYNIPQDLTNPDVNIRLGCYYLKLLYEKYGNMDLALAAYNAGKGNVDKWLKDETLSDGNGGLKKIPFEETEEYVKKVNETLDTYNELYNQNDKQGD